MRRTLTLLALAGAMAVWSSVAWAERRVALVIGNGAYQAVPALANPANDARAVAAALDRLGFEVVSGFDLTNADLRRTVRDFAAKLASADVAFFFFLYPPEVRPADLPGRFCRTMHVVRLEVER